MLEHFCNLKRYLRIAGGYHRRAAVGSRKTGKSKIAVQGARSALKEKAHAGIAGTIGGIGPSDYFNPIDIGDNQIAADTGTDDVPVRNSSVAAITILVDISIAAERSVPSNNLHVATWMQATEGDLIAGGAMRRD
jgi:hypothetical protein